MKKSFKWLFVLVPALVLIVVLLVIELTPNKDAQEKEIKTKEYNTKDNRVTFTLDETFKIEDKGDYDLYLNKNDKQIVGVFTYNLNEYQENSSKDILDKQIDYFVNSRNDMILFKKQNKIEDEEKTITTVQYSGKTDSSSDCVYIFSVIDFKADTNYVVYVNEVIIKKMYEEHIGEMINILKSAKLN